MDAAGLDGLACLPAGRSGWGAHVSGALAAAMVGDAAAGNHQWQVTHCLIGQMSSVFSKKSAFLRIPALPPDCKLAPCSVMAEMDQDGKRTRSGSPFPEEQNNGWFTLRHTRQSSH